MALELLKPEGREELEDILTHPGLAHLLAQMDQIVRHMQHRVLTYDLSKGDESEKALIRQKCRAEGAAQLVANFKHRLVEIKTEFLKARQSKPPKTE